MATATSTVSGSALLCKGDYVDASGRTCFIQAVENKLGFNVYICIDIDSGVILRKSRYEVEKIDPPFADLPDIMFEDPEAESQEPDVALPIDEDTEEETKRFKSVSDEDLDHLAKNRNSHMTQKQTTWAVKIFRGR